jgi:CRISPR/Cas system CSM-associated protein Csm3 (group 7 of RAMP superfamily)
VRPAADGAAPSKVTVLDAPLKAPRVRIRDGVALDRARGTASDLRKFDLECLDPSATMTIELRTKGLTDDEVSLVVKALRLIGDGRVPLGGASARGFGVVRVANDRAAFSVRRRCVSNPGHVVAAILNDGDTDAAWAESVAIGQMPAPPLDDEETFDCRLGVAADSSFAIGDPLESVVSGFDAAPLGGVAGAELTAASLRGALRSGAERILRTLKPASACNPLDSQSCAARERAAREGPEGPTGRGTAPDAPLQRRVERCLACRVFGNEEWASRLRVEVTRVRGASAHALPLDHVAIDRFTGGASEGKKFDELAVGAAQYDVRLTLVPVAATERPWMRGLVALTLQDLAEGRIAVGRRAAIGHGRFAILKQPSLPSLADDVRALWTELGLPYPSKEGSI